MSRTKMTPEERLAKMEDEARVLRERMAMERKKISAQARKDDTRACIIIGRYARQHMTVDPNFAAILRPVLDEYVIKENDRDVINRSLGLLDLDPLPPLSDERADRSENSAADAFSDSSAPSP